MTLPWLPLHLHYDSNQSALTNGVLLGEAEQGRCFLVKESGSEKTPPALLC